jgi:hypothetical protein
MKSVEWFLNKKKEKKVGAAFLLRLSFPLFKCIINTIEPADSSVYPLLFHVKKLNITFPIDSK